MVSRNSCAARRFILSLIITLLITASVYGLMIRAATGTTQSIPSPGIISLLQDDHENPKKGLSCQQRASEARAWHEANHQLLKRAEASETQYLTSAEISQDLNDIAVIQGNDGKIITPPKTFDLNLRAVTFTPAGGGYTISTASSLFDNNLGTRLDLTVPPAVNRQGVEPGDDAFIEVNQGFNISFFGVSYSSLAISSNGNIVFRPSGIDQATFEKGATSSIANLTEFQSGLPRIAPYWHDLDARNVSTSATNAIFVRKSSDRILITWNNIRDFPNNPQVDNGVHRFQVTLFSNGRIVFTFDAAELTTQALIGITPGQTANTTTLIDLTLPPSDAINNPVAEFFSTSTRVDYIAAVKAFYASHPDRDFYDFIYFMTDFPFALGGAFAFYDPVRNDVDGIGLSQTDPDTSNLLGSRNVQGILNLGNIVDVYPPFPTTRFLGANHALSILGHEQGHRWLAFVKYPGIDNLLLGRDDAHWSFFLNIESTISHPAARRSSLVEGNVWNDNGNNTFTSSSLIDGYSRLDQYLMGLRPASDVPDTFVIANPSGSGRTRESSPQPGVTTDGIRQTVTINKIIEANRARTPDSTKSKKNFRAAAILVVRQGTQPSQATLDKIALYRLAWESYFWQSTDYKATINTGLSDLTISRVITPASAASYLPTLAPGEIGTLFGSGLASSPALASSFPLPTTLADTQVLVNRVPASLFSVSPDQINFQIPRTTIAMTFNPPAPSATALVEVYSSGQLIRAGAFQVAPAAPAIFTQNQSGSGAAVAIDAIRGGQEPFNAIQPDGQPTILAVFGTGFGADATDLGGRDVSASVRATIDGNPAPVGYAGPVPISNVITLIGLNQINVTFPVNITSGTHTLVISRNGIPSQPVTITVR